MEYEYYVIQSENSLDLQLVPVPTITHLEPQNVFSLLHFSTLTVRGSNFIQSPDTESVSNSDLICIFTVENRIVKVPAIYIN